MSYNLVRSTFARGAVVSRCDITPHNPVVVDWIPGQAHVGGFQSGEQRPGGRRMHIQPILLELRGQVGSGSATPEDDIFRAAGFSRSGTTNYSYALGDPRNAGDTPAGITVPLTDARLNYGGVEYRGESFVAEMGFDFRAGMIPQISAELEGLFTSKTNTTPPSVSAGPLPLAWLNSTISIVPGVAPGVTTLLVKAISTRLNNTLSKRISAGAASGHVAPGITSRAPGGNIVVDEAALSVIDFDAVARAGTPCVLSWTYTAGGSSFNVYTFTQTVYLQGMSEIQDLDGRMAISVPFFQAPDAGPLTFGVA